MESFKEYLQENEKQLEEINKIVEGLGEDELTEFGEFLFEEFFDDEETDEDDYDTFGLEDIKAMITELGESYYSDILQFLEFVEEETNEELDEAISRVLKSTNKNRKKRKFMKNTKADLRKTKTKRKRDARQNKAKRKRNYRANKKKLQAYQKSRNAAIKKGSHHVKKRRTA